MYITHQRPSPTRILSRADKRNVQDMIALAWQDARLKGRAILLVPTALGLVRADRPTPCRDFYNVTADGVVTFHEYEHNYG